ncbi:TIR domain-containing protein [Reyranella sp.]|uniref:TIR domain-containing protein n=1 Tax=Reyranella sp. TaxID=1929291 RepID=UPI0027306114|nr:TIR domain-containing protein [Reyranella sp.]MDP2377307.1 TIR domain-containing protein [Reyranella sp.]
MNLEIGSIFISYASPDRDRVLPFCQYLRQRGFSIWIDHDDLKPGQNWTQEISRALNHATFVVAFVSHNSFDRRGYVQRELKFAIDKLNEKLVDDIYLIPVLLDDDVVVPEQIADIQRINASRSDCQERIVDAINHQLTKLGRERREMEQKQGVSWEKRFIREAWDGIPGYEVELQHVDLRSDRYGGIQEIGDYIKGRMLGALFSYREHKLSQSPQIFNFGQDKFLRTNTYDARCGGPNLLGKMLSIRYEISWYGAGAAHPNFHFETYNFLLDPITLVRSLREVFDQTEKALPIIQQEIRNRLGDLSLGNDGADEKWKLDPDWIDRGTAEWDHFSAYVFGEDGLEVLFAPYQVGPYAAGAHSVKIPFDLFAGLMRADYISAMHLDGVARESRARKN